jgi:hypothetical protein
VDGKGAELAQDPIQWLPLILVILTFPSCQSLLSSVCVLEVEFLRPILQHHFRTS